MAREAPCHDEVFLSFFFHARGVDLEKSTLGMYRSLLFQLLDRVPELQDVLDNSYKHTQSSGDNQIWELGALQKLLSQAISKLGMQRVIFFVDALDECDAEQVRDMIETFEQIGQRGFSSGAQFYVCFSSRHYPYIHIDAGIQLTLEDQIGHGEDMEKYVRSKLRIGTSKAVQDIKSEIIQKAAGVFLWVVLVVGILEKEFGRGNVHRVKTRLKELPPGLSELFKDILRRDNEDMESLLLCIQWVLFATRPLKVEEFYFAALSGLDPNSDVLCEWDPDYIDLDAMKRFILSSSKGLIEVTRLKDRSVQFIHESVRDFLIKDNGLRELFPNLQQNIEGSSHSRLQQCCQTYMLVDISSHVRLESDLPKASLKERRALRRAISTKFPFLDYAVHHVLQHANLSEIETLQHGLFIKFDLNHWIRLNNLLEQYEVRHYNLNASWQYILAENNLATLLSEAIRIESWNDSSGGRYPSSLFAAAASGSMETATLLVNRGADIEVLGNKRRTPLLAAIENGHDSTAQMLLEKGASIPNSEYLNTISLAAEKGLENAVRSLLNRGAEVNAQGRYDGNTQGGYYGNALQAVSASGNEKIVSMLLDRGADVHAQGGHYGNALQAASYWGHEGIVKLLLERGADVNAQGGYYGNALQVASRNGCEQIVKLLLERGADVNAQGGHYGNALQAALCKGYKEIVELLLERGAKVNAQGGHFGNALQGASDLGHKWIMDLLLERGAEVNAQGGS